MNLEQLAAVRIPSPIPRDTDMPLGEAGARAVLTALAAEPSTRCLHGGNLRWKFDGGRGAMLCPYCDAIVGYWTPSRAEVEQLANPAPPEKLQAAGTPTQLAFDRPTEPVNDQSLLDAIRTRGATLVEVPEHAQVGDTVRILGTIPPAGATHPTEADPAHGWEYGLRHEWPTSAPSYTVHHTRAFVLHHALSDRSQVPVTPVRRRAPGPWEEITTPTPTGDPS